MVFHDVTSFATHIINCASHLRILDLKSRNYLNRKRAVSKYTTTHMYFTTGKRLNHNKGSKSVPLLMKNHLSYSPFILLPQIYIAFHSTFPKISDIQLLSFIFYTTLKLLPTWLSQTLQICERSYFMLKIVAKTPRISLYSSYLHIKKESHDFRMVFRYKLSSLYFCAQLSKPHRYSI